MQNSVIDKVSVVITHFNRPTELIRCIDSVLQQGDIVLEVIVVDDFSSCLGEDFFDILGKKHKKIKIIKLKRNSGPQVARNCGIMMSVSEYVAMLDCDDFWMRDKLVTQIKYMKDNNIDVCATNFFKIQEGCVEKKLANSKKFINTYDFILKKCCHLQTSTMVAKSICIKKILFDVGVKKFQDWDFFIRANYLGYRVGYFNEPLSFYSFGASGQMTVIKNIEYLRSFIENLHKYTGGYYVFFAKSRILARQAAESGNLTEALKIIIDASIKYRKIDIFGILNVFRKRFFDF